MNAILRSDAARLPLADRSVNLTLGSPPYIDARTYGIGAQRKCRAWVDWMLGVTAEALRVTDGPVLWVVAGGTRDHNYQPAPEGLLYRWWEQGGECHCLRPCYWFRVGIPGSGGKYWYRADVEYVLAFKRPGPLPFGDPTANGHPPKWAPGGAMSHRLSDGTRRNQWGHSGTGERANRTADGSRQTAVRPSHRKHTKREADGTMREQAYNAPVLANPGNLVKVKVGGGMLGSPLAHENEAPYPQALAEWYVRSHCPPGGIVLDPFSGSGTTPAAAKNLGRRFVASDLRMSQCELTRRRLATVTPSLPFAG